MKTRTMHVPVVINDHVRDAFAKYIGGRQISDDEIRERLVHVLRCYLSDAVGVKELP